MPVSDISKVNCRSRAIKVINEAEVFHSGVYWQIAPKPSQLEDVEEANKPCKSHRTVENRAISNVSYFAMVPATANSNVKMAQDLLHWSPRSGLVVRVQIYHIQIWKVHSGFLTVPPACLRACSDIFLHLCDPLLDNYAIRVFERISGGYSIQIPD